MLDLVWIQGSSKENMIYTSDVPMCTHSHHVSSENLTILTMTKK